MIKGIEYVEKGIIDYQQKVNGQRVKCLNKQAKILGFNLLPIIN